MNQYGRPATRHAGRPVAYTTRTLLSYHIRSVLSVCTRRRGQLRS